MEIKTLDIIFSSDCNLSCKYCYLYHNKRKLKNYNKEIIESFRNKEFVQNIKNFFIKNQKDPKEIDQLSLWGAEPTLNSNEGYEFLEECFDYFINANTLFFSTNGILGLQGIIPFIEFIKNYKRDLSLRIQISIDGPEWINETNRGKGSTIKTVDTINQLSKYLYENELTSKVLITLKPTLNMKQIKTLAESEEKVFLWYKFFDDLQDVNNKYNCNNLFLLANPTIANPEEYSVQDGKNFAKYIKNINSLDLTKLNHYKHRDLYAASLENIRNSINNISLCCAGRSGYGIDKDGMIYICHRDFTLPVVEEIINNRMAKTPKEFSKMNHLCQIFHSDSQSRYYFFKIIAFTLSKYGQIDKKYLMDELSLQYLFKIVNHYMCAFGQIDYTKELFVFYTGYLKLIGNGAEEELIKYFYKDKKEIR